MHFDEGLRVDLLVERLIVVELKSVERLAPVHSKQVLTYLRLLDLSVGLLINFGAAMLKEGLHRIVNNYRPDGPESQQFEFRKDLTQRRGDAEKESRIERNEPVPTVN
jgi:iron complex transport system substrate-binding protein